MSTFVDKIRQNWQSGLTVALVNIPLSVSLAVASLSNPVAGIITAVWSGLTMALLGGSNFNIVGPTGALSGLLAAYAFAHGAESLAMLAIVTGVFTCIAWGLRLERFLVFIPASTVIGFTLGVAFIIASNQFSAALGLTGLPKHERLTDNLMEIARHAPQADPATAAVFTLFLAALFLFLRYLPKIPGAIVLAPLGILLGWLGTNGAIPLRLETLGDRFSDISGRLWTMPEFYLDYPLLVTGATIALIAILETMISAKIADGMTRTKHNKRREMFALGMANIASGLAGGIPATAALARTSLNVKTGATHRVSAGINAVAVAVISLVLLSSFSFIPMAVIAAILVFVAVRMVEVPHLVRMYAYDKKGFALALIIAAICVWEDPIIGILFGTAISLVIFMEKLSRGQFELVVNDRERMVERISGERLSKIAEDPHTLVYSIKGQLAYINSQSHLTRFENELKGARNVIIRLRELYFVDIDGIEALCEIIGLLQAQGRSVAISSASPLIAVELKQGCHLFRELAEKGLVFEKTADALRHFRSKND